MKIEELLEKRHEVHLKWGEPWPACGPEGNELHASVEMRATVHDCINLQRVVYQKKGLPVMGDDASLLQDFMAVHWASVVDWTYGNTFGAALEALKAGKRVAREGWNGNKKPSGFIPPSREPVIFDGMGYVKTATGEVVVFDAPDYDLVAEHSNWTIVGGGYPAYYVTVDGKQNAIAMHRIFNPAWEMTDHISGDKLDNRRSNLRECTSSQNNANRAAKEGCLSKYKGVSWDSSRNKWIACISAHGKSKTLGRFDDEVEAAKSYDEAAKAAYGDFARLNFPSANMFLFLLPAATVPRTAIHDPALRQVIDQELGAGTTFEALGSIRMFTATRKILTGWNASQDDLLSRDWVIYS